MSDFPQLKGDPNGTFTQVTADLDLEAQLFDFSFTYGVLDNLDVNIEIPVVRTYARSQIKEVTLDPRFTAAFPQFIGDGSTVTSGPFTARNSALGVGDIRLRDFIDYAD